MLEEFSGGQLTPEQLMHVRACFITLPVSARL